jgi:hypothetical protein
VPASYSFWDLHVAIQDAMGWLDYHLHEFRVKKGGGRKQHLIGLPVEADDRDIQAGWEVPLARHFAKPGDYAEYAYDFGDGWCHEVLREGILLQDRRLKSPVCLDGACACPPEDCGGVFGYERMIEILASPDHEEYEETAHWLRNHEKNYFPYRPDSFDPTKIKFKKRSAPDEVKAERERVGRVHSSQKATKPKKEKAPRCPKCRAIMVRKMAKRGINAGYEFWGCPHYPFCNGNIREFHGSRSPNEAGS